MYNYVAVVHKNLPSATRVHKTWSEMLICMCVLSDFVVVKLYCKLKVVSMA